MEQGRDVALGLAVGNRWRRVRLAEFLWELAQWVRRLGGVAVIESRGLIDQWRFATAPDAPRSLRLDLAFLRKLFFVLAVGVVVMAPFARDPLITAACGMLPFLLVGLLDRPRMPSVVVYALLYMWLQIAARLVLTYIDDETLSGGLYGTDVCRATWYAMASLLVLATVFRIHLGRLASLTSHRLDEHRQWPPLALFQLYLAVSGLAFVLAPVSRFIPGLHQPIEAFGALKYGAIFALFATVLSTGRGGKLLLLVVIAEVAIGFTGLFSGFKTVLIVLLLTALSVRITLRFSTVVLVSAAVSVLLGLGLFWTAVKAEYRDFATGYASTQSVTAGLGERAGLLIGKALHPGEIEWGLAVDQLVRRIAYIDFFGAVIGVVENAPEEELLPRWSDTLGHIFKPRLLFPDKAVLDDTEVFLRYVRDEVGDDTRPGTSISIGFLAENFIDFGFPLMLLPVGVIGLVLSCAIRYFMTRRVPWAVREGLIMALVVTISWDIGSSLAKLLGATLTVSMVLAVCLKFLYPIVERWLERRQRDFDGATVESPCSDAEAMHEERVA